MSNVQDVFPPKKILLPTDGSHNAQRAEELALRLAKDYAADLLIINVVTVPVYFSAVQSPISGTPTIDMVDLIDAAEKEGKKVVGLAEERARSKGVKARGEVVRSMSSVVYEITNFAEKENADLIVIGTRGLGGFKKLLVGSVSSGVVTHAHCNVIVVK